MHLGWGLCGVLEGAEAFSVGKRQVGACRDWQACLQALHFAFEETGPELLGGLSEGTGLADSRARLPRQRGCGTHLVLSISYSRSRNSRKR